MADLVLVSVLAGTQPVAPSSQGVQGPRHGALKETRGLPHTWPLHMAPMWWFR